MRLVRQCRPESKERTTHLVWYSLESYNNWWNFVRLWQDAVKERYFDTINHDVASSDLSSATCFSGEI